MFRPQLEFWNCAQEIPFFRFVQRPAQGSQGAVGVAGRASETQHFDIVFCYLTSRMQVISLMASSRQPLP